ncbi:uncharacterized protein PHACADRAFT_93066 [Phanerochaete carnosa HHB-10118-sp]|uniref:F-box domain-containing protein n=1 Tax=Phanerochaete carnosa (strain HHB-10118-sp) TaxID=650164 RepID=K5WCU6_PHACS|nr:uncharacterized protein PHACADRAFT_93066 [Phanerochaete carnosa HHB-10118-sp]EKM56799.1 hypothetical protein PHACADRAFT_93066 [Phanerochaete carnosa HHB-10118-sp]
MPVPSPASNTIALPQELVGFFIDELQHDSISLRRCSLVCKAWLPHCSAHLFASLRISRLPLYQVLLDFRGLILSSARVSLYVRHIGIDIDSQNAAVAAAVILKHLSQLESLSIAGIKLFRYSNNLPRATSCYTGRPLKCLSAIRLPVDVVSGFLVLFVSVDILDVRFPERAQRKFPYVSHIVKNLEVKCETDSTLLDVGSLVDPNSLESITLGFGGTYRHRASADYLHRFLQSAGQHIRHFEYGQPVGGWITLPDSIPALMACTNLESLTVTTPKVTPFSMDLWCGTLVLLLSLPSQTRRVELVTSCRGPSNCDGAFDAFIQRFGRHVGEALEHCHALECLNIAALDYYHQPISASAHPDKREAVLKGLPAWLRGITSFT